MSSWLIGSALAAAAVALRVWAQREPRPIGLDAWYYLAYADAVRRRPGFDVRLPQYLLQDERQSYPPLFPMLLALLPARWLQRHSWMLPALCDGAHVWLLFWAAAAATGSAAVAALAAAALALAPQAVAEAGGLHGRGLGMLLHSAATLLALRSVEAGDQLWWLALLSGAMLYLASAAMSVAYGVVLMLLSVAFLDSRYALLAAGALLLAVMISGGHYLRVMRNFGQAARYGIRNRKLFGAHPIWQSPVYGAPLAGERAAPMRRGLLGHRLGDQLLRVFGENPYVLALCVASFATPAWSPGVRAWAVCLTGLSVLLTLTPFVRFFGAGRSFMRAALFPTLLSLAPDIEGGMRGEPRRLVAIAAIVCFALSIATSAVVYRHRRRRQLQDAASASTGLQAAVECLAGQPHGGVVCFPYVYSGLASYRTGKPVLWGGHCGDLRRWEALAPVLSHRLTALMRDHGVRYILLETSYASPEQLGLEDAVVLKLRCGGFALYEWAPSE